MASTECPVFTASQDNNDNGGSQLSSDCLGTPVVLRIIMEQLCTKDLVAISLVNKLWNYEARSVLKNRGNLIAALKSNSPCKEVGAFASDLRQMNVVPFSGISINLSGYVDCEKCEGLTTGVLDPNYNIILDRIQWKCLRFEWGDNCGVETQKCQAFLLAQKILQNFSGDLQELKFHLGVRCKKFMRQVLRKYKFPQLKLLYLGVTYDEGEDFTASTKALLSRAPKLEEFHENYWVDLEEHVVEGSPAVLITHQDPVRPAYDELSEGTLAALRVVNLDLEVTEEDFSIERFNRVIPLLLENSKTTLKDVSLDAVFALPLMCYGVRLESVTHMTLRIDYCHLELTHPRVLTFLKAFDFTRMFPNLSTVDIQTATTSNHMAAEQTNEFILQANALLPDVPIPDRAANITDLGLFQIFEYSSAIPFLVQMFPNTKSLWIRGYQEQEFPYGLIWEHFKTVENLSLQKFGDYYRNMWPKNFDSVFCGIFPEEVAELMKKDDEYLRNVNIVPVMPAITCLSGLKNMEILILNNYGHTGVSDEPLASGAPPTRENGSTFLFSKVTGLIAFARMPRLSIYISIDGDIPDRKQALGHLKRYATIWV